MKILGSNREIYLKTHDFLWKGFKSNYVFNNNIPALAWCFSSLNWAQGTFYYLVADLFTWKKNSNPPMDHTLKYMKYTLWCTRCTSVITVYNFIVHVLFQIVLVHDPRPENAYDKLYTVQYLGNMTDGRLVLYINQPVEVLKQLAAESIKKSEVQFR